MKMLNADSRGRATHTLEVRRRMILYGLEKFEAVRKNSGMGLNALESAPTLFRGSSWEKGKGSQAAALHGCLRFLQIPKVKAKPNTS